MNIDRVDSSISGKNNNKQKFEFLLKMEIIFIVLMFLWGVFIPQPPLEENPGFTQDRPGGFIYTIQPDGGVDGDMPVYGTWYDVNGDVLHSNIL